MDLGPEIEEKMGKIQDQGQLLNIVAFPDIAHDITQAWMSC